MLAALFDCPGGTFVITLVIHGIENAENINAHFGSLFHKSIHQIVRIVSVTD
jgi:hypothetical protein